MKIKPAEVQKYTRWWEAAQSSRKEIDWKWFQYDLWVEGLHYAKWDKGTKQVISAKDDGRPKVTINKIYSTLRSVRNYTLRNRPKAEVTPHSSNPDVLKDIAKQSKFLDYMHDELDMRFKLKGTVWDALRYSVGYWQVLWDEDLQEIVLNDLDPYDVYWDSRARRPEEAKYVILAVRRNLEDMANSSLYNQEEVKQLKGDKRLAASTLKERLIRFEMGDVVTKEDEGTVIVQEIWHFEYNKDKQKEVWITTMAESRVLRHEKTDLERLPFFVLPCDINPRSMYGQGWVKNLISPNKELNRVMSHIAEWNFIMNRGKWVSDVGAGVRIINNENGQIIQKKRGYEVKQANIVPMSPIAFSLKDALDGYLEDIGGFHEASMGRIPPGARSGDAVEALQAGDANNMSELVENLEDFLEEVFEYILELAAKKYQFVRTITPLSSTGQREYIKVIGEEASSIPEDAAVIPSKALVDVKITSWLANTAEARQRKALELFQAQLLDEQSALEFFEVGNVSDVILRLREKREREMREQQQQQEQMLKAQTELTREPSQEAGEQQAIAAIRSILMGEQPILPNVATPGFIEYMDMFLETEQSISPEQREVLQKFRDQVAQTAGRPFNK